MKKRIKSNFNIKIHVYLYSNKRSAYACEKKRRMKRQRGERGERRERERRIERDRAIKRLRSRRCDFVSRALHSRRKLPLIKIWTGEKKGSGNGVHGMYKRFSFNRSSRANAVK